MKECIHCHKQKSESEFSTSASGRSVAECKECRKAYFRNRKRLKKEGTWEPYSIRKRPHEYENTKKATRSPTVRDLEWAAGFLEGEGWFRSNKGGYFNVGANQKFPEPLYRLQEIFGGTISTEKNKDISTWSIYGMRAHGVMLTLFSLLSTRRRQQIQKALKG